MEYQSSSTPTGRMQRPSTYLQMPWGHWAMEHTSTGRGSVVTGHLIRDFPCGPFSGRNCLPSLQQPALGDISCKDNASLCTVTTHVAIVQAWSNQSARHPGILHLLRTLFFITAKHSFIVRLVHLPGTLNRIADALSHNQLSLFSALAPQANPQPTPVPPELAELCHQMEKLLCRALAPSIFNTYQTGIKRYYDFCSTHHRKPLPA